MLTEKERRDVIKWLREYPAGVPDECWGTGPFQATGEDGEYISPWEVDEETAQEYG